MYNWKDTETTLPNVIVLDQEQFQYANVAFAFVEKFCHILCHICVGRLMGCDQGGGSMG
jgi:hypothetical protein